MVNDVVVVAEVLVAGRVVINERWTDVGRFALIVGFRLLFVNLACFLPHDPQ